VAKTRRSKKGSSSKRAKPAKKANARKASKKAPKKAAKKVELKKLRREFGLVLGVLSSKVGASPEATAKLDDTRRRIIQWMADIDDICTPEMQEICGPDMAFPIP